MIDADQFVKGLFWTGVGVAVSLVLVGMMFGCMA